MELKGTKSFGSSSANPATSGEHSTEFNYPLTLSTHTSATESIETIIQSCSYCVLLQAVYSAFSLLTIRQSTAKVNRRGEKM